MKINWIFTARAADALKSEFGEVPSDRQLTNYVDALIVPVAGDLISDDRVSRRVFVVSNRMFLTDVEGTQSAQLLLDVVDAPLPLAPLTLISPRGH